MVVVRGMLTSCCAALNRLVSILLSMYSGFFGTMPCSAWRKASNGDICTWLVQFNPGNTTNHGQPGCRALLSIGVRVCAVHCACFDCCFQIQLVLLQPKRCSAAVHTLQCRRAYVSACLRLRLLFVPEAAAGSQNPAAT